MSEKIIHTRVAIIGAGLTGLSLAWYLKKKGIDFILLEKEPQPGGVIRSYREKGFVYEGGPNTGVTGNLEVMELFRELEGDCSLEIANPAAKRRLIWKQDRWHALPSGLGEALSTPLFTWTDKLRILGEPFRPRGKDPMENVASLVRRRLGNSFLEYAVDPFISGIFAGDPSQLVTRFALPKLYQLEQNHGSFIGGAIQKKFEKGPRPSREVFSVQGGLDQLVRALVRRIGPENILTAATHTRVGVAPGGFQLTTHRAGSTLKINAPVVVPTLGAHALGEVFPFFPIGLLEDIAGLEYARVVQVVLGFSHWKGCSLKAFGGLVPSRENRRILGALFPSSFLSGRAPKGGALLNVFLGGSRKPHYFDLPDEAILEIVRQEISEMMQLPFFDPGLVRIFRYLHAIPQYDMSSALRMKAIQTLQKSYPGLIMAGNLHEGIGMADRIAQAARIANLAIK